MFIGLYNFFSRHKAFLYTLLVLSSLLFSFFAFRVHFEEDISKLVPGVGESESSLAFNSLKVKDKVFLQFPSASPEEVDAFMQGLLQRDSSISSVLYRLDNGVVLQAVGYALEHLPTLVDPSLYPAIDQAIAQADEAMARNREILWADESGQASQRVFMDPLGITQLLLPEGGLSAGFTLKDGQIYSNTGTTALAFLSPDFSYQDSQKSEVLQRHIEAQIQESGLEVLLHGAPVRSVGNARTIKRDLAVTIGISFLLILLALCLSFKSFNMVWQIVLPVVYGTLFGLAGVYVIKGSMSLMAFGICAIVLGVAVSYCLHILIHHRFTGDIRQLLREEATPVCLGCLTTMGAFIGLLFTKSELLRDFGIFATLALLGSSFFTLVFLPHLLKEGDRRSNSAILRAVDRVNSAPYDRSVLFIGLLTAFILVGLVFSPRVQFDSDLRHIGYESPAFQAAEARYSAENQEGRLQRYYAAAGNTLDEALQNHKALRRTADSLLADGSVAQAPDLVSLLFITQEEQLARIRAWETYWTPAKREEAMSAIRRAAIKQELDPSFFDAFQSLLEASYAPGNLYEAGILPDGLLSNYIEYSDGRYLVFSPLQMDPARRDQVDKAMAAVPHSLVVDPMFYSGGLVESTHRDFNAALLLSSLFVLAVLLLSFRNLWVSLLAFLPMALSWYVVQGWMALLGLQFNLINIVLSTFIFGIGVDYSIFVMQGLLAGARGQNRLLLDQHKTAIFFSAFVLLVVMLSLLAATHPAIRSIGLCSIIGMGTTILISYSLQPLLFRQLLKVPFIRKSILREVL